MNGLEESIIYSLNKETYELRNKIWGLDIPSATISEYVNLHHAFSYFIEYIDENILSLFCKFCTYINNDDCDLKNKKCFQNSWFYISEECDLDIESFINQYYENIRILREIILNRDVIPLDNPNLKEHHQGCIIFINHITLKIIPLINELKDEISNNKV